MRLPKVATMLQTSLAPFWGVKNMRSSSRLALEMQPLLPAREQGLETQLSCGQEWALIRSICSDIRQSSEYLRTVRLTTSVSAIETGLMDSVRKSTLLPVFFLREERSILCAAEVSFLLLAQSSLRLGSFLLESLWKSSFRRQSQICTRKLILCLSCLRWKEAETSSQQAKSTFWKWKRALLRVFTQKLSITAASKVDSPFSRADFSRFTSYSWLSRHRHTLSRGSCERMLFSNRKEIDITLSSIDRGNPFAMQTWMCSPKKLTSSPYMDFRLCTLRWWHFRILWRLLTIPASLSSYCPSTANWLSLASKVLVQWPCSGLPCSSWGLMQVLLRSMTTKCSSSASVSTILALYQWRQQKKGTTLSRMCSRRRKLVNLLTTSSICPKTGAWFDLFRWTIFTLDITSKSQEQSYSSLSESAANRSGCSELLSSVSSILEQRWLRALTRPGIWPWESRGGTVRNSVSTWGSTARKILRKSSLSRWSWCRGKRYLSRRIFSGRSLPIWRLKYQSLTNQEQELLVSISWAINSLSSLKEVMRWRRNFQPNPKEADLHFCRIRYCTLTPRYSLSMTCPLSTTWQSPRISMPILERISLRSVGMADPDVSTFPLSLSERLSYSWLLLRQSTDRHSAHTTRTFVQMASQGTLLMYSCSTVQQNSDSLGLADTHPSTKKETSRVISLRAKVRPSSLLFMVQTSMRQTFLHLRKYSQTISISFPCESSRQTCSRKFTKREQKLGRELCQAASALVSWMRQATTSSMTARRPSCQGLLRESMSSPQRLLRCPLKALAQGFLVSRVAKMELLAREGLRSRSVLLSFCLLSKQSLSRQLRARTQKNSSFSTLNSALPSSEKSKAITKSASSRTTWTLRRAISWPSSRDCLDSQSWVAVSTTPKRNSLLSSGFIF